VSQVTHYPSSSRGLVPIASMHFNHALKSRDKLIRENGDPKLIEALSEHIAGIEATFGDKQEPVA
jgi:hypothetical protein